MKVIYADELAAINFAVDYLLLAATARLAGLSVGRGRLAGGAAAGAAYAVLTIFPAMGLLASVPARLAVGFGMTRLAFGRHGARSAAKLFVLFLLVAFGFAGCVSALYLITGTRLGDRGVYYFDVPLPIVLAACAIAYVLGGVLFSGEAKHGAVQDTLETVKIRCWGREEQFRLLLDTGNDLADPVSGRPVLVLERRAAARLLPAELLFLAAGSGPQNAAALFSRIPPGRQERFCLLPYRAVGTADGLLLALRPDAVTRQGRPYRALVAISPHPVAKGRYEGLIGL